MKTVQTSRWCDQFPLFEATCRFPSASRTVNSWSCRWHVPGLYTCLSLVLMLLPQGAWFKAHHRPLPVSQQGPIRSLTWPMSALSNLDASLKIALFYPVSLLQGIFPKDYWPSFFWMVSMMGLQPMPPSMQGVVVQICMWNLPTGSLKDETHKCPIGGLYTDTAMPYRRPIHRHTGLTVEPGRVTGTS